MADVEMVCHQVNCRGVMGRADYKGEPTTNLAQQLRNVYGDDLYKPYRDLCSKSGGLLLGQVQILKMDDGKFICNMFAQDSYGRIGVHTDYNAFESCCKQIVEYCKSNGIKHIGMPYKIGCNRGGGYWLTIQDILFKHFQDESIDLTIYSL